MTASNTLPATLSAKQAEPGAEHHLECPPSQPSPAADETICWIEVKQSPFLPDHQVELLHLQAEADALLLQLQAISQRRQQSAQRH